jgi:hypothetical protein
MGRFVAPGHLHDPLPHCQESTTDVSEKAQLYEGEEHWHHATEQTSTEDVQEDDTSTNQPRSGQHAAMIGNWLVGLPDCESTQSHGNPTSLCFFSVFPKTITAASKEVPCRMLVLCLSRTLGSS